MLLKVSGAIAALVLVAVGAWLGTSSFGVHGTSVQASTAVANAFAIERDLSVTIGRMTKYVDDAQSLTVGNCGTVIGGVADSVQTLRPDQFDLELARAQHARWIDGFFQLRLHLQSRLREFSDRGDLQRAGGTACVQSVRRALRYLRYAEDYLILWSENPRAFEAKRDEKAGPTLRGTSPQLLTREPGAVKIRSGDVMLSRGDAFVSAAIARIGTEEAQFSHLAQIFINAEPGTELTVDEAMSDPRVLTIEAHIEVGTVVRQFKDYVGEGNARVLLFRPRLEAAQAHRAAKYVADYVRSYAFEHMRAGHRSAPSANDNPPYDFAMDLSSQTAIFCSEVVAIAYRAIGLKIPTFESRLKKNEITKRMEITAESTFAPADLEIDPHFEQLAEWRDLRKLSSVLAKDAVLNAVYRWMDERGYVFRPQVKDDAGALIAWTGRQLDLGFEKTLPKNMPRSVIAMTFLLERIGSALEKHLVAANTDFKKSHAGLEPFFPEQQAELEAFRAADLKVFQQLGTSAFHGDFRAP